MFQIKEKPKMVERALLLGAYTKADDSSEAASLLEELEELLDRAEALIKLLLTPLTALGM